MAKKILTYSSLTTFQNCKQKYKLRYIDNLTPLKIHENLFIGTVWHKCLEMWHDPNAETSQFIEIEKYIDKAFSDRDADPIQKKHWHLILAMFQSYTIWESEISGENLPMLEVESSFRVPIINPDTGCKSRTFDFAGVLDGIIGINSPEAILENKSASGITGDYIDKLECDFQINLYSMATQIDQVVYNIAVKVRLKQGEGESEEEYEERKAALIAKSKSGKSSAKQKVAESDDSFHVRMIEKYENPELFQRVELYISPNKRKQTQRELWDLSQQIILAMRNDCWTPNWSNCFKFGASKCPYWELCSSDHNPNIRDNFYTKKEPHEELQK